MKQRVHNKENVTPQAAVREPTTAGNRSSVTLFIIAFVFTGAVLAWLSWSTYDLYTHDAIIKQQVWRAEELQGNVIHLDEVLTMSARMAATTGEQQWETRYRRFEPQLDQAIKEIQKLVPSEALDKVAAANLILMEMENRAFTLVRENKTAEARAVLSSQQYETQKEIYAQGMGGSLEQLQVQLEQVLRTERNRGAFSAGAGILVLSLLLFTSLVIIRRMYKAQAVLFINITGRKQTEEALRKAQGELEVGVQERTSELTRSNTSLKEQIIERERAEAALRKSEESYRDLFENARDIIYAHDLEGNYTSVNKACERITGYTHEETIGLNFSQVVAPGYLAEAAHRVSRPINDSDSSYEMEILAKDGSRVTLEVNSRRIYEDGKPIAVQGIARDITERKRVEEAFRKSESIFQSAFDYAPNGIALANLDGRFIQVNNSCCDILGYTKEELLATDFQSITHPDDLAVSVEGLPRLLAGEITNCQHEKRYIHKLGHEVFALTSISLVRDAQGAPLHFIAQVQEITERKRAETERQAIAEIVQGVIATTSLDELFNLAHVAIAKLLYAENCFIALHDLDTNLMHFDFWVDEFDPAPSPRLVGKSFSSYLLQTGQPLLLTEEQQAHVTGPDAFKMSGTQPASWLGVPLRTGSRTIGVLVVQHYDKKNAYSQRDLEFLAAVGDQLGLAIERKRIEFELKANAMQLTQAQAIAKMGSWEWDVATNKASWSDELYRLFGWEPQEFVATFEAFLANVHPDDRELVTTTLQQALRERAFPQSVFRIIHQDGSVRTHQANAMVLVNESKRAIKLWGTSLDITERKVVEVELEQARDAALESVRLKSEFLANTSHEIRTPMNGVIGMTGLLLDTDLSAPQREYTEIIQTSAEALLKIIDDILDFSKIEAGLMRFEKIDFELRGAVEATVELLAERAQTKGLELVSLVYRDVPTELRGDPGRLRQVLTNLIGNAVKFTEEGEVEVSVKNVGETPVQVMLRFEIRDTGLGISNEAQRGLFRAFTQADGSTTRKYGGTGLGLAISKQLVELMGGEIGIKSAPGQGATFWFTGRFEKQLPPAAKTEPVADLSGARVLIVDDNATNRNILRHQTNSWGMLANEAESGKQALELLRAAVGRGEPYDIAVLDLMMPDMDGFQLAEAIKSDPAIAAVALVLLPSYAKRGQGERARQTGIAAYLQKPVRQTQLFNCLAAVMGHSDSEPGTESRLVTRHSLRESKLPPRDKSFSSLRILIAEDNLVNQKVALGQLYSLGYRAEAVPNGRELLKALENDQVDIILMDCQMPEMDGFAATAEIRRREGTARHTTIIAMTSNALDGDREGCLAAGMDDYLSKPVKPDVLQAMLERWSTASADVPTGKAPVAPVAGNSEVSAIDFAQLAAMREIQQPGQADFVTELIDLFLKESDSHLKNLREAVRTNDAVELRRLAHVLKGSSANMGGQRMAALCGEMEANVATNGEGSALFASIDREFSVFREALIAERRGDFQ